MALKGMPTTNGHVRKDDIIRLGDITPKRVEIDFGDGRDPPLKAWLVSSRRYPASVSAELDDARNDYIAANKRVDLQDQPVNPRLYQAARILVDQVTAGDASQMAADGILGGLVDALKSAVEEVEASSVRASQQAWATYVTRCLMAVVPGLEYHEADILGSDRERILVKIGLFPKNMMPPDDDEEPDETDDDDDGGTPEAAEPQNPPAPAPRASTGARRGRASRVSTT